MAASRSCAEDFETIERLGSGSFGTVYKVRRIQDGEFYVIKEVRIAELTYDEQVNAINEVKLLAQMDSPYVVRYYDSFLTKDSLHIVMEFCNKGDVQSLLKKAKSKGLSALREPLIWNIGLQIMLGLYYIHKKKVLHRDLKTANVFLEKKSTDTHYKAKIGDLGVAKLLETSTAFAQTIIGTPYYLSPELCADQPYRDKSDCWALGVILYECCTLDHPFDARNQCALILKIIQSPLPPFTAKHAISPPLQRLVTWLLEKDPAKRPSVKMLLCEKTVRDALRQQDNMGLVLPPELESAPVTNVLDPESNPNPAAQNTRSPALSRKSSAATNSAAAAASGGGSGGNTSSTNSPAGLVKKSSTVRSGSGRHNTGDAAGTAAGAGAGSGGVRVRGDRVRRGGKQVASSLARERHQIRTAVPAPVPRASSNQQEDDAMNSGEMAERLRARQRHQINIVDDSSIDTLDTYSSLASEAKLQQMRQQHQQRQEQYQQQQQQQQQVDYESQGKVGTSRQPDAKVQDAKRRGSGSGAAGGGGSGSNSRRNSIEAAEAAAAAAAFQHDIGHGQGSDTPGEYDGEEYEEDYEGGDGEGEEADESNVEQWYEDDPDLAANPDDGGVAMAKIEYSAVDESDIVDYKRAQESFAVRRLQSVIKATNPKDQVGGVAAGPTGGSSSAASHGQHGGEDEEVEYYPSEIRVSSQSDTATRDPDNDPFVLKGLIKEYRDKSLNLLGDRIFRQVYDLCHRYMMVDIDPDGQQDEVERRNNALMSSALLNDLEKTICEHLGAGIDVACEVVFNVKLLLALESRLQEQQDMQNR